MYDQELSVLNKIDELRYRVSQVNPDLRFLTETWLKPDTQNSFIKIPGFKTLRKDSNEIRGGVLLLSYLDLVSQVLIGSAAGCNFWVTTSEWHPANVNL